MRAPNWVGDAILCTPALTVLKERNPSSQISVLAQKRVAGVFLHNPSVDEIIPLSERKGLSYWRKALELRKRKYNIAVLFPNSFSSALFFRLSGVSRISGYSRDRRGVLLTDALEVTKELLENHQVKYYCHIAGDQQEPPALVWAVSEDEKNEAKELLEKNGVLPGEKLVAISPGATFGRAKRWPAEYFAALADELTERYSVRILVFGTRRDKEVAAQVCGNMQGRVLDLAGKTSLRQLGALLSMCRILISNDSGTMHVGAAVRTPVVAIFGSTDPSRTGPWGSGHRVIRRKLDCSPCFAKSCPRGDYKCLREIGAKDVLLAVEEQLGKLKNSSKS